MNDFTAKMNDADLKISVIHSTETNTRKGRDVAISALSFCRVKTGASNYRSYLSSVEDEMSPCNSEIGRWGRRDIEMLLEQCLRGLSALHEGIY